MLTAECLHQYCTSLQYIMIQNRKLLCYSALQIFI
jgi:hypothetical protein